MINWLRIRGYRCFSDFLADDLGQVNLLVGRNNSGKTALLEAIELVSCAGERLDCLWRPLSRRAESLPPEEEDRRAPRVLDARQLFLGRTGHLGASFEIVARDDQRGELLAQVDLIQPTRPQPNLFNSPPPERRLEPGGMALRLAATGLVEPAEIPLTGECGLDLNIVSRAYRWASVAEAGTAATFIPTGSLSGYLASQCWQSIALTEEEEHVTQALQILDQSIQRIGFVGLSRYDAPNARGGVLVKCRGVDRPVPIGSLGEGMWRMLSIAIALVRARGGILLVDEVDTGLHYSVMEEMWNMVLHTSLRLNVQVFATTHSSDCIDSLANVCRRGMPSHVTLQRIDAGNAQAVAYSQDEIWAAAQHGIETR